MLILAIWLSVAASASDFTFKKKIVPDLLDTELATAGIKHGGVHCEQGAHDSLPTCSIRTPSKDPSKVVAAHIYRDVTAERKAVLKELAGLELKLDAGTATDAEVRRTIILILKAMGI